MILEHWYNDTDGKTELLGCERPATDILIGGTVCAVTVCINGYVRWRSSVDCRLLKMVHALATAMCVCEREREFNNLNHFSELVKIL